MKIALLSDIHDHIDNMLTAFHYALEKDCSHLLFMGDMESLSTLSLMCEEWPHRADIVFGNNEYDLTSHLMLACGSRCTHHKHIGEVTLDGRRIIFSHYAQKVYPAVLSGEYDAAFFGHTHRTEAYYSGHTLVANPGEVGGVRQAPSFAVYDTATNSVEFVAL